MVHLQPKQLRIYLRCCDTAVILVLCECLHNDLRDLSTDKRRALLLTETGFELIQLIIPHKFKMIPEFSLQCSIFVFEPYATKH